MSFATPLRGFQTGKLEARRPAGLNDFKTYFATALGPPPEQAHYGAEVKVPWQMDGNGPDPAVTIAPAGWGGCGDCVVAGSAHYLTMSNFDEGGDADAVPTANAAVETYCQLAGCTTAELFADPAKYDTGLDISSALQAWHTTGLFGVKLGAYAPVDYTDLDDVRNGLYLCGGLIIGIQLPQSAEQQFPNEWNYVAGSPNLGGHCITLSGYNATTVWGETWGELIAITWEFLQKYMDEAWAPVSAQAIEKGTGPNGLNVAQLQADLAALDS
jgi:hypothetical protein